MKGKAGMVAVCFTLQAAICVYCCLMAFLWSAWFVNDSVALQTQSSDWVRVGMVRFGQCMIVAGVFAAATFAWNLYVLRVSARVARLVALPAFLVIVISSLVGAVQFVWTKPFM